MNSEEIEKDLHEIKKLLGQATRERVKEMLLTLQKQIEDDLIKGKNAEASPRSAEEPIKRRCVIDLTEYGWDQSDKYVKIFATMSGVEKLITSDVETIYTDNSIMLLIRNLNDKDYCLKINNLLNPIDVEASYHKVKTDMVVIYMKKQKEGENWSFLTVTEKRVKEIKDSAFKADDDMDEDLKNDPSAGIMNLMKKMYQSGDAEMKRTIEKAWTESQEKQRQSEMNEMEF